MKGIDQQLTADAFSTHDPQTLLLSVLLIEWKDICVTEVTDL